MENDIVEQAGDEPMDVEGSTPTEMHNFGTTKDDTEANVSKNVILSETDMTSDMTPVMTTGYEQTAIADFLAKPVIIDEFFITAGTPVLKEYALHSYLHESAALGNIWWNKLQGYYGVKGTFVIRAQINAQKFQSGRYMMAFEPMYYDMIFSDRSPSSFDRTTNLTTYTQLPRVELDLATQSEMTMRIPYRSLAAFYNILDGTGTWGRVTFRDYIEMRVGPDSPTRADVTIWLSLEDVELSAPTLPTSIFPQSGDEEKKPGPFERGMAITNKIAMIGSNIPYIKRVAKPLTWVSSIGEKVCAAFGWSKPTNTYPIQRFNNTLMQYQSNNSGLDNAFNMGLSIDNAVQDIPAFGGTYIDEASMGYIKTRSAFYSSYEWLSSEATGTEIVDLQLSPATFQSVTTNPRYFTPLAGLANVFSKWRGSFTFKFKFAKTCFHSGRLAVCFIPGFPQTALGADTKPFDVDLAQTNFCHREILDIRNQHEFSITIPYTAMTPYLDVSQPMGRMVVFVVNSLVAPETAPANIEFVVEVCGDSDFEFAFPKQPLYFPVGITTNLDTPADFQTGMASNVISGFRIVSGTGGQTTLVASFVNSQPSVQFVVDDFQHIEGQVYDIEPGTVITNLINNTGTVDPQVYLNAGLYAYDTDGRMIIYEDHTGRFFCQNLDPDGVVPQGDEEIGVKDDRMIGTATRAPPINTDQACNCIGEQILSLKNLALRTVYNTAVGTERQDNADVWQDICQRPHLIQQARTVGTEIAFCDYYSYVGSCFAFVRGGTIVRYQVNDFKRTEIIPDDSRAILAPFLEMETFQGYVVEKSGNIISVYVPQYANTIGRLVTRTAGNDTGAGRPFGQTSRVVFRSLTNAGVDDSSNLRMGRSAADDTQFGFFLGFPPMIQWVPKTPAS